MNKKVDIFQYLREIDDGNLEFFHNLTNDERKSVAPYVVMMWMSGTKSKTQILLLNELLNTSVFSMPAHSELLHKLAFCSSDGNSKKYNWPKKKKNPSKASNSVKIVKRYYKCSSRVAQEYLAMLNSDDVIEMAHELGEPDSVIKEIRKNESI